jgi:hypothetical protein
LDTATASGAISSQYCRAARSGLAVATMILIPFSRHFFRTPKVYADMDLSVCNKVLSRSTTIALIFPTCFTVITAVVIGNIAGLIPLFPGGIGIRDLVTVTLLTAGSIAAGDAKTAQLLSTAIMLLTFLSGGVFFIFDMGKGRKK